MVSLALALAACASLIATQAAATSPQLAAAKSCRKTLTTKGSPYAKKRLSLLLTCVDRLLKCEVLAEIDGSNQTSCRSLAEDSCNNNLGSGSGTALSKAQVAFDAKGAAGCAVFGLAAAQSTAAGGLWFANDATCGGSADVPTLVACLRGEVEKEVDAAVGKVKPRAGILLTNMGLGDEFPNVPLPPIAPPLVIAATAPSSGVLVNPGTINVPAGTALRIEGDPNLSCGGGGTNGRLTVTIGSQVVSVKEPWGPTEFALIGPYASTGLVPYTIDLKDGPCHDSTTGNVNVTP
jgi:hypothetical protein